MAVGFSAVSVFAVFRAASRAAFNGVVASSPQAARAVRMVFVFMALMGFIEYAKETHKLSDGKLGNGGKTGKAGKYDGVE